MAVGSEATIHGGSSFSIGIYVTDGTNDYFIAGTNVANLTESGVFQDFSVSSTATDASAFIGDALKVKLGDSNGSPMKEVAFDNVRFTVSTNSVPQNLLVNGSFENGLNPPSAFAGDYRSLNTGSTDITGWIASSRVDWTDLDTNDTTGVLVAQLVYSGSSVSQTFATVAGQSYIVSFALYPSYSPQGSSNVVTAGLGGSTYAAVIPVGAPAGMWYYYSTTFVASSSSSTLIIENLNGTYNDVGPFLDNVSVLFVQPSLMPSITQQPANITVVVGTNAAFTVAAAGAPQLTYQWQINGTNLTDSSHISGSTSTVLTISNALVGDAGNYDVVVSNSYGSVTSAMANLFIITAPQTNGLVFASSSSGAWAWFQLIEPNPNSTTYYPTSTNEYAGAAFQGYVMYGDNSPYGPVIESQIAALGYQVLSTWVLSSSNQTLNLVINGDDGHSLFVDGQFLGGAGFGVPVSASVSFTAGVPRKFGTGDLQFHWRMGGLPRLGGLGTDMLRAIGPSFWKTPPG